MAGSGRRLPAAGPARRSVYAGTEGRPRTPQRARHRLRHVRRARRTHPGNPPLPGCRWLRPGRTQTHPGRRLDPLVRAAEARRPARHPDERAAPAGRPAGARRQAVQPDRTSRRGHRAIRRHGERAARARLLHATHLRGGTGRGPADHRGPGLGAGGDRGPAGADRRSLRRGGRCAGGAAQPGAAPAIQVAPHVIHSLPPYDLDAYLIELDLLLDWYLPRLGVTASDQVRADYTALWTDALQGPLDATPTWVLRDFHSPNLIWLQERLDVARVGLLDFQDAMMGPAAYDVASLLQDARVDVPELLEVSLLGQYVTRRSETDANFEPADFIRLYATLAAQRASKILGIFARLDRRDGKPQYIRHMPRVWGYLQRSLAHPSLAALQDWYSLNVQPPTPPQT
ncbi:MAG: phosphotransferase [Alphaproteobacteria bacterium]|nr:phosphotransferase [Alphaproteobacteria bacterium]